MILFWLFIFASIFYTLAVFIKNATASALKGVAVIILFLVLSASFITLITLLF